MVTNPGFEMNTSTPQHHDPSCREVAYQLAHNLVETVVTVVLSFPLLLRLRLTPRDLLRNTLSPLNIYALLSPPSLVFFPFSLNLLFAQ